MYMPSRILALEKLQMAGVQSLSAFIIALEDGDIRIYSEKTMVASTGPNKTMEPISNLYFGRYGREDNCLITVHVGGAIQVRILPRNTKFNSEAASGPPPEQDIPLPVPKKTQLYVEQTQREHKQATVMHRVFQRELCKLRLSTARAYVKMVTQGRGPSTVISGASLRCGAEVRSACDSMWVDGVEGSKGVGNA